MNLPCRRSPMPEKLCFDFQALRILGRVITGSGLFISSLPKAPGLVARTWLLSLTESTEVNCLALDPVSHLKEPPPKRSCYQIPLEFNGNKSTYGFFSKPKLIWPVLATSNEPPWLSCSLLSLRDRAAPARKLTAQRHVSSGTRSHPK